MRARFDQCSRLARYVSDPRTTGELLRMADEGEADLARLEAGESTDRSQTASGSAAARAKKMVTRVPSFGFERTSSSALAFCFRE